MSPETDKNSLIEQLKGTACNRVPLVREVLADLDTPLSTYLKLANAPYSYLFESVHGGEKWGRYSIIGLPCRTILKINGRTVTTEADGEIVAREQVDDPLSWITAFQQRYQVYEDAELPRFTGGLVGYFGYETIAYIESRLDHDAKPDPLGTPDILLMVSDEVIVFDNLSGKLFIVVHVDPNQDDALAEGEKRLAQIEQGLHQPVPPAVPHEPRKVNETDFVSGFTEDGFKAAVEKARQYIIDGDIMPVVLSQRLAIPFEPRPIDLYRSLRSLNPSPYMYFLDLGDHQVVGSSPGCGKFSGE